MTQRARMRSMVSAWLAAPLAALAACGSDEPPPEAVTVEDSAGIQIVTIHRPAADFEPYATLDPEPSLTIGTVEGGGPEAFGTIGSVWGLPDASVLISDGRPPSIRQFSATGEHIRTIGREGEGPGEYSTVPSFFGVEQDIIWVWDRRSQRISAVGLDGAVVRSLRLETRGVLPLATVPGGGFIGWTTELVPAEAAVGGVRVWRGRIRVHRFSAQGLEIDTVVAFPGLESGWFREDRPGLEPYNVRMSPPYGRSSALTVTGEHIVGGPNDRFELNWWGLDGTLRRVSRFRGGDRALTAAHLETLRDEWEDQAAGYPSVLNQIAQWFAVFETPEWTPAFRFILADPDGNAWVGEHVIARPPANPTRWWVFDAERGVPRGYVDTPEGFYLRWVGDGYVLGVIVDDLGVGFVRRYDFQ